jgi:predicted MFS family arabinose efflux permease
LAGPIALLVGFGTYLFHNTLQTHATQMAPAVRGTAVALFAFCLFAGQAIGVTAAGYAFDHWGYVPLLLVPAGALALAGWWFARALRRRATEVTAAEK